MVIDMLVHPMLYGEICTPVMSLMDSVLVTRIWYGAYGPHGLG